jgi:hypothetical protein
LIRDNKIGAAREIRTPDPIITNVTVRNFLGYIEAPRHSGIACNTGSLALFSFLVISQDWIFGGDTASLTMSVMKLTKGSVDALTADNRSFVAFDADLAGFGVRVMPSGLKSWIVEFRPHSGGRTVAKRRITLGRVGQLTPEQARKAAAEILALVKLGRDPAAEKLERRTALTVKELTDAFAAEHVEAKLKDRTAEAHGIALERLNSIHGSLKAGALTRAHLASMHSKMRDRPFAANRSLAVWGKLFAWAGVRGLVPNGHNPARGIERYRENGRERYLTGQKPRRARRNT